MDGVVEMREDLLNRFIKNALAMSFVIWVLVPTTLAQRGQPSQPGVFDYYLFNLSWEPEFCHSQRNAASEECQAGGRGFVVHGLWPQFTAGYPAHCSNAPGPADPSKYLDFMPSTWLLRHEWETHGTCSGLSPDAYFELIRRAYASIKVPDRLVKPSHGLSMAPSEVKRAFVDANPGLQGRDMAVSCGNNYLTAVEFCLNKDTLSPMACGAVRDCKATVIRVAPVR
jgi:ribonuclease T2